MQMEEDLAKEEDERAQDGRILRVRTRFFRLCAEEELTPYERAKAWQGIAETMLRETEFKIATATKLATLLRQIPEIRACAAGDGSGLAGGTEGGGA
jgi:hypothetical protein